MSKAFDEWWNSDVRWQFGGNREDARAGWNAAIEAAAKKLNEVREIHKAGKNTASDIAASVVGDATNYVRDLAAEEK